MAGDVKPRRFDMNIKLLSYSGKRKKINKNGNFYNEWITSGTLKADTSFLHPIIEIEKSTPPMQNAYNYMYIPQFKRYYFINDIVVKENGLWELHADVDVLFSNYKDIFESKAILNKSQEITNANLYINDGSFVMDSHKYDQVITFPSGLSANGHNILICAGGKNNV